MGADYISEPEPEPEPEPEQDVRAISGGHVVRFPTSYYDEIVIGDVNDTSWKIM